ncbi:MAG: replication-associated recombination protein A [Gammaproteobacteria bacterium]|nr:replication-associated recombination protein A [Gammaproteobacteria bacterium]
MTAPLAALLRPNNLNDFFGQTHLLGKDKPLRRAIETGQLHSMIFWGPPGTGKTTLAKLLAQNTNANFITLSAVLDGVKEIRLAIENAKQHTTQPTILFVDEVHRFNKAQQDAFLPFVEDGTVTFIGATTENPSFELNNALLSRARVYVLKSLTEQDLLQIIQRATQHLKFTVPDELQKLLISFADGDARRLLNIIEILHDLDEPITEKLIQDVCAQSFRRFDKHGEIFHDLISALHKSVRGSSPDAALYWLCRMLDGGCDPLYIARRIVRMASEDIGNADPRALELALNAWDIQERLGHPEGELALAQAILYMACAPKSNAVYTAYNKVMSDMQKYGTAEIPLQLRNAPTKLMKSLGYGKHYRYAHDEPHAYAAGENYFPDAIPKGTQYYFPTDRGLEIKIKEKLAYLRQLDKETAPS